MTPPHTDFCLVGADTRLERSGTPRPIRLDGPEGSTHLVLRTRDGRVLWTRDKRSNWLCLAYNRAAKRYVLGEMTTEGDRYAITSVMYLSEDAGRLDKSAFTGFGWHAATSGDGRFVAFTGSDLFVLDTSTDKMAHLGKAPAKAVLRFAGAKLIAPGKTYDLAAIFAASRK